MEALFLVVAGLAVFAGLALALAEGLRSWSDRHQVSRSLTRAKAASGSKVEIEEESFNTRVIKPMLTKVSSIGGRLTPETRADEYRKTLELAGSPPGWDPARVVTAKVAGVFVGAVIGVLLGLFINPPLMVLTVPLGAGIGYIAPDRWLSGKIAERSNQVQRDLPDVIDMMTIAVQAGTSFDGAMAQVRRNTDGPLADEFGRTLQDMQFGMSRADAFLELGQRYDVPELKSFVSAVVQADSFGIPISNILTVQAEEMRVKRRQNAEEAAAKLPVKVLAPLMLALLPALFIIIMAPVFINAGQETAAVQ